MGPKHIVHCKSGLRATFAASLLERHGRDVVLVDGPALDLEKPSAHKQPAVAAT